MKQNIKRVLLLLCMITCFFALSACGKKEEVKAIDPQIEATLSGSATSLLTQLSQMTTADLEENLAYFEENIDYLEESEAEAAGVIADGIKGMLAIKGELGEFGEVISSTVVVEEKGYSCTVQARYANRNLEYKMFFGKNRQPTSMSFNPEYTVGEKMVKAGMNTLMGMGTVFAVLIFISILIGGFKYISVYENRMKEKSAPAASEPVAPPAAVVAAEPEVDLVDDLELVAVITAAIAASQGTSADGLVVRSIRRASAAKWKRA